MAHRPASAFHDFLIIIAPSGPRISRPERSYVIDKATGMTGQAQSLDPLKLKLLVETCALRALLVDLYVERFSDAPDPVAAAEGLKSALSLSPTKPPAGGSQADPTLSDLVTGMTDEAIDGVLDAVIRRLESRLAAA